MINDRKASGGIIPRVIVQCDDTTPLMGRPLFGGGELTFERQSERPGERLDMADLCPRRSALIDPYLPFDQTRVLRQLSK
jgi:hypothetical protein